MFRFNNPDALLVLLMTGAAYCTMRAVPAASWRWLAAAGALMGFAFLTKMLQGFLVLPGFALAYALFAPTNWVRRIVHLLGAAAAVVVAAGWWVVAVQVVPTTTRPYIGGSTDNTVLDLAFGYNGIGRIVGRHRESDMPSDWHGVPGFGSRTGCIGCSPARWATRSRGCCWRHCSHWHSECTWPRGGGWAETSCAR